MDVFERNLERFGAGNGFHFFLALQRLGRVSWVREYISMMYIVRAHVMGTGQRARVSRPRNADTLDAEISTHTVCTMPRVA